MVPGETACNYLLALYYLNYNLDWEFLAISGDHIQPDCLPGMVSLVALLLSLSIYIYGYYPLQW